MKIEERTPEYIKECIYYDKDTGIFTWKVRPSHHFNNDHGMNTFNSKYSGKPAGTIDSSNGYLRINILNKRYYAHRLAWFIEYGYWPSNHIDHINGNKLNNKIDNLREANSSENSQNQKRARKDNKSSGLLGVSFNKQHNKYEANINVNKKRTKLGFFNNKEEAHDAYLKAKSELHPFGTL